MRFPGREMELILWVEWRHGEEQKENHVGDGVEKVWGETTVFEGL